MLNWPYAHLHHASKDNHRLRRSSQLEIRSVGHVYAYVMPEVFSIIVTNAEPMIGALGEKVGIDPSANGQRCVMPRLSKTMPPPGSLHIG